ncbi:MAG: pyridoxamine 5'-phosphate oxidase family protein [Planctomycetota bacterium]
MKRFPSDIAFTPAVKAIQTEKGSRPAYARVEQTRGWATRITPELEAFLGELDMFYLATSNGDGQPYVQYRGGPPGCLQVTSAETLAFADYGGNQQYITLGNLAENAQAFIFLIDYVNRRRIKLWGTARVIEGDGTLIERLHEPAYPARLERVIEFTVAAWDVNCPQHIHRRYPDSVVIRLKQRIAELEAELATRGEEKSVSPAVRNRPGPRQSL